MKKHSDRESILAVAERWETQYPAERWPEKQAILKKLKALDLKTATREDVSKIIGSDNWVAGSTCDQCKEAESIIQLGEEPDYESATINICESCLRKAVALIS